ncbi:Hsp20/alpha crystallin family protein [Actinotignum sanguinis]|uniref:Hsp20 family protein n=2 Tax=Actinomycetaceae TaxID=2049 RepID=A0ABZ0RCL6_9ACTO|nr:MULTISPECIES: Hsp20 family protein [Actinotignum]WPJ89269.1 Hsp20 family protein [Schaalia turicensis]MDE1552857.1 Hsp20 family protein [Actinotignum sanguinis]MDE1565570.1 Hsp20 family protein [Actinotignum sanguinis]MDE1577340.1 Hsp20 family protein [Actinotignum sanguinis]MDE1642861.1 Hsp20 family protein [Actinotignum sanguinis]
MAYDIDRTMSTAMDRFLSPFDGFFAVPTRMVNGRRSDLENLALEYRSQLKQTEDGYEVLFDVPGFSADDIDLNVYPDHITLKAAQEEEIEGGTRTRSVSRTLGFDQAVDTTTVDAHLNDGVLTVSVKTTAGSQGRKVQIGSGKATAASPAAQKSEEKQAGSAA